MIKLGEFSTTGKLFVTDPCYDRNTWCQGTLDIEPGNYEAFLEKKDEGMWGVRCAILEIRRPKVEVKDKDWQVTDINVGVDSGQAGFFDDSHFPGRDVDEDWYRKCCDITLAKMGAGTLKGGVVSSSGFGDGGYNCYVYRNKDGVIVAARIDFLPEYEDDDE